MAVKLDKMNRKQLLELRAEIDTALVEREKQERVNALDAAKKAAAEFGFSLDELTGKRSGKTGGAKAAGAAKFANPADKTQTWTGKGRQPVWYKEAISAGKTPEDLAI